MDRINTKDRYLTESSSEISSKSSSSSSESSSEKYSSENEVESESEKSVFSTIPIDLDHLQEET